MGNPTTRLDNRATSTRRYRGNRLACKLAAASLAGLLALTACSSSSTPKGAAPPPTAGGLTSTFTTPSVPSSNPVTASSSATPTPQPGDLTYIGSFTNSGPGSNVTMKVSIGQPIPNTQGGPPADVLSACRWNDTTTIAQSVYVHGRLTISYTGSLPESVAISEPNLLNLAYTLKIGAGDEGPVGLQGPDGSWHACGTGSDWSYDLQPNSTVTVDMWMDYMALSNAHPTFNSADQAALAISFAAGEGGSLPTAVSGPNAAKCTLAGDTTMDLLLYSTPPYTYNAKDLNGTVQIGSCAPAEASRSQ